MFFFNKLAASLLIAAGVVTAQGCAEAQRFGDVTVTPSTVKTGDTVHITANYTCAIQKGNTPNFVEYTIVVPPPNNSGFEAPVLLARHAIAGSFDQFNAVIPDGFWNYSAPYSILEMITYPRVGATNGSVQLLGGVFAGITLVK